MTTAIWWVRRDLRLSDNQALASALTHADQVLPVFVLDPALLASPCAGQKRLAFLLGGLRHLDAGLRKRGSRLIVRRGDPVEQLAATVVEAQAEAIFAEADVSPYARQRDGRVAGRLPLHLSTGLTVFAPGTVLKDDGEPYVVFTPYSRKWQASSLPEEADILPAPEEISTPAGITGQDIPNEPALPDAVPFPPGEAEAQRRLRHFVTGDDAPINRYQELRNRPDLDGTSQLSPYLRFGMLSARQAVVAARQARGVAKTSDACRGTEAWLTELIWREFYIDILYHFPRVRRGSFRPEYDHIPWDNDETAFVAWRQGRTGYPIVDAAMRQLSATGWMHNRARMIVASFLVKDLLIDWRWGERWFMQQLVDGDPAANNGGWQWTAGTGTDAAPYFRVFNPVAQGKRYDPDGNYVRRWVPELSQVATRFIHEPAKMSSAEQRQAACVIGQDYPEPMIDHKWARQRTLDAYARARGTR